MKANDSLLDLVLEAENLDRVPRSGFVLRGIASPESVAAHSWHVATLVWILARRTPGIDVERALGMALIHDLGEVRLGDLPRTAGRYFEDGAKARAESALMDEMLAPLPGGHKLFREYQEGESDEARLVKACDKLQLMIKVFCYERWGARGLAEFWRNPANFPDPPEAGGFAAVHELFQDLFRRREETFGAEASVPVPATLAD